MIKGKKKELGRHRRRVRRIVLKGLGRKMDAATKKKRGRAWLDQQSHKENQGTRHFCRAV